MRPERTRLELPWLRPCLTASVDEVTPTSNPTDSIQMNGGNNAAGLDDHIYQRLLKERIVFLGSEVKDQNANAICAQMLLLNAEDPDSRHLPLHQLARRLGRLRDGDLRHDAVHPQRRRHRRDGPGRLDGPVPALRRHQGQALRPAARAHHDAPAVRRHGRLGVRHQDPGRAVALHQEGALRADQRATPARASSRSSSDADRDRWFTAEQAPGVRLHRPRRSRKAAERRRRRQEAQAEGIP